MTDVHPKNHQIYSTILAVSVHHREESEA